MNTNLKKVILIFGGGLLLFWAFKKIKPIGSKMKSSKSSSSSSSKIASDDEKKNAVIILKAYTEAKKAGESKTFLDEMNAEFAREFKMKVYTDKGSGRLFAADLEGNKIL
jgi:hypothetical protein